MSGIDIAGLILGAVPVVIAALEHYKTLHRKTWSFKHKSLRIDQLIIVYRGPESLPRRRTSACTPGSWVRKMRSRFPRNQ